MNRDCLAGSMPACQLRRYDPGQFDLAVMVGRASAAAKPRHRPDPALPRDLVAASRAPVPLPADMLGIYRGGHSPVRLVARAMAGDRPHSALRSVRRLRF